MPMRYVPPAAEQKRVAIEKFEKFRSEGIISAAAARQSQRVTTRVTTVERVREVCRDRDLAVCQSLPPPFPRTNRQDPPRTRATRTGSQVYPEPALRSS